MAVSDHRRRRRPWPVTFDDPRLPFNSPQPIDQHAPISQVSNGQISVDLTLNSRSKHIAPPTHAFSKTTRKPMKTNEKYIPLNRSGVINRWKRRLMVDQTVRSSISSKNGGGHERAEREKKRVRERDAIGQMGGGGSPARLPTPFYIFGFNFFLIININISIILNYLF